MVEGNTRLYTRESFIHYPILLDDGSDDWSNYFQNMLMSGTRLLVDTLTDGGYLGFLHVQSCQRSNTAS